MLESDADKSFSQSTLQQTAQQRRINSNDTAIAQREREIDDIAKGIIELADIFKDLQTMVIDQGTMLDRVDYNVERMKTDVKGAEEELKVVSTCWALLCSALCRLDTGQPMGKGALITNVFIHRLRDTRRGLPNARSSCS